MDDVADSVDYQRFRTVLGHLPTAVTVITAAGPQGPVGLAIGSFASISLDPPLVGFFVAKTSTTWPVIRDSGAFCANVLGAGQVELSRIFARSGPDKFNGVQHTSTPRGLPLLPNVVAWVDCTIQHAYDAGDHDLCIGRVTDLGTSTHESLAEGPLIFYRGEFGGLSDEIAAGQHR